jgi:hypothetical protein
MIGNLRSGEKSVPSKTNEPIAVFAKRTNNTLTIVEKIA